MRTGLGTLKAAIGIAALAALTASPANSQCVKTIAFAPGRMLLRQLPPTQGLRTAPAMLAAYSASPAAAQEPIVGFWKVKLIAEHSANVPDGTVVDQGYQQWHSDGTEMMNSSRPPATSSFCLGVWEKTGPSAYRLNHFAISWNPDGSLLGPARFQVNISVSHDHNSFAGTFTIDQYNQTGVLQSHVGGRIEGGRITVDTPISGALLN